MKKLLLILFLAFFGTFSFSQGIKKYPIGNSGCSAYFFCNPGDFSLSYSEDSSKVYTGGCQKDSTNYWVILVQFAQPVSDSITAENLLVQYLDFLKTNFKITRAVGYGKGHRLRNSENTRGVIDYWKDADSNNWKVKGWTNGKYIAVMCAFSRIEPNPERVNVFLDGILLQGM